MTMSGKVVLFDCYQTLIQLQSNERQFQAYIDLSEWLSYHGFYITPYRLFEQYHSIVQKQLLQSKDRNPDVEIGTVFRELLMRTHKSSDEIGENLIDELCIQFRKATTISVDLISGIKSVLEILQSEYVLGIVSNTQRKFTLPELVKFDINRYFNEIVFSSDMLCGKPNKKIFKYILNRLNGHANEAIIVGDSLENDIIPAAKMGMKTVWVKYCNQDFPDKPAPNGAILCQNVEKLPEIIRGIAEN